MTDAAPLLDWTPVRARAHRVAPPGADSPVTRWWIIEQAGRHALVNAERGVVLICASLEEAQATAETVEQRAAAAEAKARAEALEAS